MSDTVKAAPTQPSISQLLSIDEAATILDVSRKSVSNWIHDGALPAIRLGPSQRLIRIRQEDLEAFIEAGKIQPTS